MLTNKIVKITENENYTQLELAEKIIFKLGLIKEELVNIEYAIHWAKANIINAHILSNNEIDVINKVLEKEDIPFINFDELFEFASSGKHIIYLVSIPTTNSETCQQIFLRAINKGTIVNELKYQVIIKCKQNEIFGIISNCKSYNELSICNKTSLMHPIFNEKCWVIA